MLILGIETSCDDTAVAVVEAISHKQKAIKVLSNTISSQIGIHSPYGGVVPTLAAREHEKNLPIVLLESLAEAGVTMKEIDLIAVTAGPGLAPSLWRGVEFANALAEKEDKPLFGVNHMMGHIASNWLGPVGGISNFSPFGRSSRQFPISKKEKILNLIVSGGHTELILMSEWGKFKKIGATLDDAAGEAFDKVARLLGLGFPGGPVVSKLADDFQAKTNSPIINLPRPMLHSKDFNFSFSGLKTAVLYWLRDNAHLPSPKLRTGSPQLKIRVEKKVIAALCHEFQNAVVEVLVKKTLKVAKKYEVKTVALSGGVSANRKLRETLQETLAKELPRVRFMKPEMAYTGDNGAMIALAGYLEWQKRWPQAPRLPAGRGHPRAGKFNKPIKADANWEIA